MSLGCSDTTNGYTNVFGSGCEYYERFPSKCATYDVYYNAPFNAKTQCCTCQWGNSRNDKIHTHISR